MNNVSFKRLAMVHLNGASIPFEERPFVVVEGEGPVLTTEEMLVDGQLVRSTLKDPIVMAVELWQMAKEDSTEKEKASGELANELGQGLRCLMDERELECLLAGLKGERII